MKVLIATADFGEDLEVYYAVHRLIEEGIEPVVAAPVKKRLQLVVHDFEPGYDSYTEKFGHTIEADISGLLGLAACLRISLAGAAASRAPRLRAWKPIAA